MKKIYTLLLLALATCGVAMGATIAEADEGELIVNLTPAPGTYFGPVNVKVTVPNAEGDLTIIWMMEDGEDENLYDDEAGIAITRSGTLVVYVEEEPTDDHPEGREGYTEATYYIADAANIAGLAEVNNLPDGTVFTFTGTDVYVNYQHGPYLYLLQDVYDSHGNYMGSLSGLIYGDAGISYELGDLIPAGWKGRKTTVKGLDEIEIVEGLQPATQKIPDADYCTEPFDYNGYWASLTADAQSLKFLMAEVKLAGIDDEGNFTISQQSYLVDENGNEITDEKGNTKTGIITVKCVNRFGLDVPRDTKHYFNVVGMWGVEDDELQLYPISIERVAFTFEESSLMDNTDVYVSDVLYVAYVDTEARQLYVTDNLTDLDRSITILGQTFPIPQYPTWGVIDCSGDEAMFDAIKDATALSHVTGLMTSGSVNPTITPDAMPVVETVELPEITYYIYDLGDDLGIRGTLGNQIIEVSGIYAVVDGVPTLVGDATTLKPAVEMDLRLLDEDLIAGDIYSARAIVKLHEAWEYGAPAVKRAPALKGRYARASKDARAARIPARIKETDENYDKNCMLLPIEIIDHYAGVNTVGVDKQVAGVEYINTLGRRSHRAFDGVNIRVTTYTDGTTDTVKVVK